MSDMFIAGDPDPLPFADVHPAWCAAHGRAGKWAAVGASTVGAGHIRRYRARDDAFLMMAGPDHLAICVADGVGGQIYSRLGAAHCVHRLARELLTRLARPHVRRAGIDDFDPATITRHLNALAIPRTVPVLPSPQPVSAPAANWGEAGSYHWNWRPYRRPFPTDLFEDDEPPSAAPPLAEAMSAAYAATRESFLSFAASARAKPRQLTCTLLAIIIDLAAGEAVTAQLGDGAILRLDDLTSACPASPRTSEDNPYTIADSDWRDGFQIGRCHAPGYLVMTDGVEDFFPAAATACRTILSSSALDDGQRALELLAWLNGLSAPNCEDDRTLAACFPA